jgi:two-component system, NarL family, response regulator LiaR
MAPMDETLSELTTIEGEPQPIKILIVDDHPLMRNALKTLLVKQADFQIVGEAGDGEEAVKLATELSPDVIIMDISMPKLDGLQATQQIKMNCPRIAVLVLTVHDEIEYLLGILKAGAAGYLTKNSLDDEVTQAVRRVVAGEMVLSPALSDKLIKFTVQQYEKPLVIDNRSRLSSRELEVLRLAAKGLANKDIASELNLSLRTVKGYFVNIFSKLGVASRTEAVIVALQNGLIFLHDKDQKDLL